MLCNWVRVGFSQGGSGVGRKARLIGIIIIMYTARGVHGIIVRTMEYQSKRRFVQERQVAHETLLKHYLHNPNFPTTDG